MSCTKGSCGTNWNGNKRNGMFQANLGSMRSNARRLSKTMNCVKNKKMYTYSDKSTTTHDNSGAFTNRKFTKMGLSTFRNSNPSSANNLNTNSKCN
jgi:hypothetical protein